MKNTLISVLAIAGFAAAQGGSSAVSLPQCALSCFQYAVAQSGCDMNDGACQCGKGAAKIESIMEPCLCQSDCQSSEFEQTSSWSDLSCRQAGGSPFSVDYSSCSNQQSGSSGGGSVMVGGAPPITAVPTSSFTQAGILTATPSASQSSPGNGTPNFFSGTGAQITPAGAPVTQDGTLAVATGSPTSSASSGSNYGSGSGSGSGSGHHGHSNGTSTIRGGGTRAGSDAQTTTAPGSASRVVGGGLTLVGLFLAGLMAL